MVDRGGIISISASHVAAAGLFADAEFEAVAGEWESLAQDKPFWATLTAPEYRHLSISSSLQEIAESFLETGRRDVEFALSEVQKVCDVRPRRALDFGCGPGRLARALAEKFEWVVGADASRTMVDTASVVAGTGYPNLSFTHMRTPKLPFEDHHFDFVLSLLVIQHQPLPLASVIIEECCRVLHPHGAAALQIPVSQDPSKEKPAAKGESDHRIKVYATPHKYIEEVTRAKGCEVKACPPMDCVGPGWDSRLYIICRN